MSHLEAVCTHSAFYQDGFTTHVNVIQNQCETNANRAQATIQYFTPLDVLVGFKSEKKEQRRQSLPTNNRVVVQHMNDPKKQQLFGEIP